MNDSWWFQRRDEEWGGLNNEALISLDEGLGIEGTDGVGVGANEIAQPVGGSVDKAVTHLAVLTLGFIISC